MNMKTILPTRVYGNIKAGSQWSMTGRVLESDGKTLADLTTRTARMDFVDLNGDVLVQIDHTSGLQLSADNGTHNLQITLTSAQTMRLNNTPKVFADLVVVDGERAYPIFDFHITIQRMHTQWQTSPEH